MEHRIVRFDHDLKVEAHYFQGIMQKFPNHFHEHYVLGFVECGGRLLTSNHQQYTIETGDLVMFNPLENHTCEPVDNQTLDWRCINIEKEVMKKMTEDITGKAYLPIFTPTIASQSEVVHTLKDLHEKIIKEQKDFDKEETFYFLIEQLLEEHTEPCTETEILGNRKVQKVCDYIEENYAKPITLDELSKVANLNKYTLLRNFTIYRGITPYQYLSTIRVNKAKKLLESGVPPADAALQSGFTDQSHFTRFFKNFIGLTPKLYQNIFYKNIEKSEDRTRHD